MPNEEVAGEQPFFPFPPYSVRSKEAALSEILEPCERFKSSLTLLERTRIRLMRELLRYDMLANVTTVIAPGIPLNWQVLLKYLHEQKVITEPRFFFNKRGNDLPKVYGATLLAKPDEEQTDGNRALQYGYAISSSAKEAMAKVVGEMLERFFLTLYHRRSFVRTSYDELRRRGKTALDIRQLNGFLPWQIEKNPRYKRSADAPLYWIKGEAVDGRSAYIPAQLVFWNYSFSHDVQEPILAQATTNGAGGHFTKEEATLSGLLENIERDGFLIYWLNSLAPKIIDVSATNDRELREFLASVRQYGLDIYFLDTTTDVGIPAVTSVIVDRRAEAPVVVVSAACGLTIKETILKSGREALNILQFDPRRKDFSLPERYEPFTDSSVGQPERIAIWKGEKMLERFEFFLRGESRQLEDFLGDAPQNLSPAQRLEYVVKKLRTLGEGYEVYLYEAKHEVLETLGYRVVHTIVPQLISLYLNERMATLDSKRLREVPAKLGYRAAKEPNPWPHPFP